MTIQMTLLLAVMRTVACGIAVFCLFFAPWAIAEVEVPGSEAGRSTPEAAATVPKGTPGETGERASGQATEQSSAILSEIVVTATRVPESTRDIPQSVTVVARPEIQRKMAETPNEVLRESPGIWSVQVTSQGSPVIRGQIGNRVLYLWDGIRINNGALISGPNGYFNQYPVGAIDRLEVIRGPGSVQYGSDAIGGAVNIVSKRMDMFPSQLTTGAEIFASVGTGNSEMTQYADAWSAGSKFSIMAGLTNQNVGNYRGPGEGIIQNTGFESVGGYLNMAYKPKPNQTFRLSWIYDDRENIEFYVSSKLNTDGIARTFAPYERRGLGKVEYIIDDLGMLSSQLKMYAYTTQYEQMRETRTRAAATMTNKRVGGDQRVYGVGIQNSTPLSTTWGEHRFVYGADYRTEDIRSSQYQSLTTFATGKTVFSVPFGKTPDGTYEVADAFAIMELHPMKNLILTFGGRFEQTALHGAPSVLDMFAGAAYTLNDLQVDKTWRSATWSTGAVYGITRQLDLAANIATGFRAPTFSDVLSGGTPIFSTKVASLPSPDTDPEQSITYEFGPRFHSQRWNVNLAGYWTQLSDVIRKVNQGTINIGGTNYVAQTNTNSGKGYVRGIEFASAYKPHPDWTLFANATYTQGYDTRFNEYYRFIPPLNGVIGGRYEAPSKRWWVEVVEIIVDRLHHHSPTDETDAGFSRDPGLGSVNLDPTAGPINPPLRRDYEIPGYALTNVRMGTRVWQDENKRSFDVTLAINNLLDKSYREPLAQQQLVAPGINFILGGRMRF